MGDVLEPARSGRARCRGCGQTIQKGELRFGEEIPNPFGDEGETTQKWFHLPCAAEKRPEKVQAALGAFGGEIPQRDVVDEAIAAGITNPGLVPVARAERAPTGRARCRECRRLIERGTWRVVMDVEDDVAAMASTYSIHASCAPRHVGTGGLMAKLRRRSALDEAELADLEQAVARGRDP
jgi:hypothetical protein